MKKKLILAVTASMVDASSVWLPDMGEIAYLKD